MFPICFLIIGLVTGFFTQSAGAKTSAAPAGLPFLQADGAEVVAPGGKKILLKGCDLGNWLMIEPWMLGGCIRAKDQAEIFSVFRQRFGDQKAEHLIDLYRGGYITARDFQLIKTFGFNVVRLPFDYRILQSDVPPYPIKPNAFVWLDKALSMARQAGVYVILDLHGAPGGQSNQMHTGQADQNHLWDNPTDQDRTVALWHAIAERYKDQSVVAGYDLLNEPYGDFHQDLRSDLKKLMPRLYTAIRSTGDKHIIFLPGALNGGVEFYGNPHERGWQDVGFTEHYYAGLFGDNPALESHARVLEREMPAKREQMRQWKVPYYVGEFNVVLNSSGGPRVMRAYYDFFAKAGWPATMWSYKLLKTQEGTGPNVWYMVTNAEPLPKLDLHQSSYEDFEKFFGSFSAMKLAVNEPLRRALTETNPPPLILRKYPKQITSAPATDKSVFETGPLQGYHAVDIGGAKKGAVEVGADGTIRIWGSGSDIFSTQDSFRFVSRAVQGKSELAARVLSVRNCDQWAKAGVMARWGDSANAAFAFIHVYPDGTVDFSNRPEAGAMATESKRYSGLPVDLKLIVADGRASGYYRAVGGDWRLLGSVSVPDQSKYQLGLAVTSHSPEVYTIAKFQLGNLTQLATPSISGKEQLLVDGSFEKSAGWNQWGDAIQRQTDQSRARTGSGLMVCQGSKNESGLWQNVKAIPGQRYTLSIWANRQEHSPADGKIELRLEASQGDQQITLNSRTFTANDLPAGGHWLRLSVSGTAINDTLRALIIFTPEQGGGKIDLDDASLTMRRGARQ